MSRKQGKIALRKGTAVIIGEGFAERSYADSLRAHYKLNLKSRPLFKKSCSVSEIERLIFLCIEEGYGEVHCIIDMDNKDGNHKYHRLKQRMHDKVCSRKGYRATVRFYETHRCTELWFLYHFRYTTTFFAECEDIIKQINKHCVYDKSEEFHSRTELIPYFTDHGGSVEQAVENANRSLESRKTDGRAHSYSEMGQLLKNLGVTAKFQK